MPTTLGAYAFLPTIAGALCLLYAVLFVWGASRHKGQRYFGTFIAAAMFLLFIALHFQTSALTARMVRLEARITDRAELFSDQRRDANARETMEGRIAEDIKALKDLLREAIARRDRS